MIRLGSCLLFTFVIAFLGCKNSPDSSPGNARDQHKSPGLEKKNSPDNSPKNATPESSLDIAKDAPLEWLEGSQWEGGRQKRLALLLSADTFLDANMNIAFTNNNIRAMKDVLSQRCGFSKKAIVSLTGKDLVRDAVEATLMKLAKEATASENLLIVYFTGHGFINKEGQASFFTYYSEHNAQANSWDKVITRAEFASWIARARGLVEKQKKSLRTLIIVDACRTRTMAPPPKARLRAAHDWELYGTGEGSLAEAPKGTAPSPFTKAFVDSLSSFSKASRFASLTEIFKESSRRVKAATKNRQIPQLLSSQTGIKEPQLLVPDRVNFSVEVIDSLTKIRVPRASILLDNRLARADGSVYALSGSPSSHLLKISAKGYLSRSAELNLERRDHGKLLRVELQPSLTIVKGVIDPVQVARIVVTGDWKNLRKGYHKTAVVCDSSGRFRLKIPHLVAGAELSVYVDGTARERRSLPKELSYFKTEKGQSHNLGVVDLGTLIVARSGQSSSSTRLILQFSEQSESKWPIPKQLSNTPEEPTFNGPIEQQDWQNAVRAINAKKWELALRLLKNLSGGATDEIVQKWILWVKFQRLKLLEQPALWQSIVKNTKARKRVLHLGGIALWLKGQKMKDLEGLARSGDSKLGEKLRKIEICENNLDDTGLLKKKCRDRRLTIGALALKHWLASSNHNILLEFITSLDDRSPWSGDQTWKKIKHESLSISLPVLLANALSKGKLTGQWKDADKLCSYISKQDSRWLANHPRLVQLIGLVEQEHIPLDTRLNFNKAQEYFADGKWLEAHELYRRAESSSNAHYKTLIRKQLRFLDQSLALRFINEGYEHEFEGRLKEAALAYEKALPYNPRVARRIKLLIEDKKFSNWQGVKTKLMRKIDKLPPRVNDSGITENTETFTLSDTNLLNDRLKWNKASIVKQDQAIKVVGERLGSSYKWIETREYSCNGQKHRIATFKHVKSGIEMNLIPGGRYQMGSNKGVSDEKPVHTVTIKAMLVGRYEVTQAQWQKIAGSNPSHFKGSDRPVEQVSWDDIQSWLKKAGDGLRLPSESEWEYAGRSGTQTKYFWGAEMDDSYCWYRENSASKTHAVTEHMNKANAFGLVDMSGNVWEWCQDKWINNYNNGPRDSQPRASNSSDRVVRGGGWCYGADYCRSAYRYNFAPSVRNDNVGFRVSRTCS
jgi:formylglycine-generating enzyme required for sulfatase activity